jgi:hypothetical protein
MMMGFDILLRALAQVGKSPRTIRFPVPTLWYPGFGTFVSHYYMRKVCKETEHLLIRQLKNPRILNTPSPEEEMLYTTFNFPALKHLTIDMGAGVMRPIKSQFTALDHVKVGLDVRKSPQTTVVALGTPYY